MANIDVMYSSKTDQWATPDEFGNSKQAAPFPSMVVIFRGAGM